MHWEHPQLLILLLGLPLVVLALMVRARSRTRGTHRFLAPQMASRLAPQTSTARGVVKTLLVLGGLAALVIAAAGPQYGLAVQQVQSRGLDLFVLLDVSRSMQARDVAPNRLERAKSDIRDLVATLKTDRVGLIAFAGAPTIQVPLTTDYAFFEQVLESIDTDTAPRGGSLIGDAIRKAIEAMPDTKTRDQAVVLITDGEDHDSFPRQAAEQAAERNIRVFAVGLGDADEGTPIPVSSEDGSTQNLRHQGQEVRSKMDEELLRDISLTTGGAYVPARTRAYDLGRMPQDHLVHLTRGTLRESDQKTYRRQFPWFLAAGFALLLLHPLVPVHRSERSPAAAENPRQYRLGTPTALLVLAGFFASTNVAYAGSGHALVQAGVEAYRLKEYAEAERHFADAVQRDPTSDVARFNHSCALAAQGKTDEAIEQLRELAAGSNRDWAARSHRAIGHLMTRKARSLLQGKAEQATEPTRQQVRDWLQTAIDHFRRSAALTPDSELQRSTETVRLWLDRMQTRWSQRDRQEVRDQSSVLEFVEWLETQQSELRDLVQVARNLEPSPKRSQLQFQSAGEQRELADELPLLKHKLAGSGSASETDRGTTKRLLDAMAVRADAAQQAMMEAADQMDQDQLVRVLAAQVDADNALNDVYLTITDFPSLLQRAIMRQEKLVQHSEQFATANPQSERQSPKRPPAPDFTEAARRQHRMTMWSRVLRVKAESSIAESSVSESAGQQPDEPLSLANRGPGQLAEKRALELCPEIARLCDQAASALDVRNANAALPDQREALRLLRQIAAALPPDSQNEQSKDDEQQDEKDQQQKDQQQKDQQQNDEPHNRDQQQDKPQDNDDQQRNQPSDSKPQQEQDPQSPEQRNDDADSQPKEPKEDQPQKSDQGAERNENPQDSTTDGQPKPGASDDGSPQDRTERQRQARAQAESVLRKVRERERRYIQLQKELQRLLRGRADVEKDW